MKFEQQLMPATLIRRYKRFLADMEFGDGTRITVHCPNTGAMLGCQAPGSRVWLSRSGNPRRKYAWTWELVEAKRGVLVGINTARTNRLVEEGIRDGVVDGFGDYGAIRREYSLAGHRFDFLLSAADGADWIVEVKNVTAAVDGNVALFPDAVSARGASHVRTLAELQGDYRCALIYCVQREDVAVVRPAAEIDPAFAEAVAQARAAGVHVAAYGCCVDPAGVHIEKKLETAP